jgi:hypothetical protein
MDIFLIGVVQTIEMGHTITFPPLDEGRGRGCFDCFASTALLPHFLESSPHCAKDICCLVFHLIRISRILKQLFLSDTAAVFSPEELLPVCHKVGHPRGEHLQWWRMECSQRKD